MCPPAEVPAMETLERSAPRVAACKSMSTESHSWQAGAAGLVLEPLEGRLTVLQLHGPLCAWLRFAITL